MNPCTISCALVRWYVFAVVAILFFLLTFTHLDLQLDLSQRGRDKPSLFGKIRAGLRNMMNLDQLDEKFDFDDMETCVLKKEREKG